MTIQSSGSFCNPAQLGFPRLSEKQLKELSKKLNSKPEASAEVLKQLENQL
jgi:hypothetical protein